MNVFNPLILYVVGFDLLMCYVIYKCVLEPYNERGIR